MPSTATPDPIPAAYRRAPAHVPAGVRPGVWVAEPGTDEVVVFLIGMRVHRWRRLRTWFPVAGEMPRMLAELTRHPADGLLGARTWWSGRNVLVVQYWASVEQLGRYAKSPDRRHRAAWARFNARAAGSGDVGIWHETYRVAAADVETLYGNMPPMGLALATAGVPIARRARRGTTADRLGQQEQDLVAPG
jgi:Domain of unknown function (DUF4188)